MKNRDVINEASKVLVGGVNSPVRAFKHLDIEPIPIQRAQGSKIYDYDSNVYIDYMLSFGAMILGHSHPDVVNSVKEAANDGFSFGATNLKEVELASLIKKGIGFIDKIRFVNSGTEALMSCVRLARGYTKKNKIIKFANSYHGHADGFLAQAGSGLSTLKIPISEGVPENLLKDTIVLEYGDFNALEKIFQEEGKHIAAVVVEPVGGNHGVVLPDIKFLKKIRALTRKNRSLLIFDEVITGFRFLYGSVSEIFNVYPDLICLGKIIGGGLPIGAFAGANKIMRHLAPEGKVYQASTFAGNPIVMTSGIATLKKLHFLKNRYNLLNTKVSEISSTIQSEALKNNIAVEVTVFNNMFSLKFKNQDHFKQLYRQLISRGIYLAPSEYEANFISFEHTKKDILQTKQVIKEVFKNLK